MSIFGRTILIDIFNFVKGHFQSLLGCFRFNLLMQNVSHAFNNLDDEC